MLKMQPNSLLRRLPRKGPNRALITSKDKNRPLLQAEEPAEVILQRLLDQRGPLYEETADYIIETANNSIHSVIQAIIKHLK